ncbi:type IV pili methyl-accepting chemotaxis transducer N-terminal domain-containing protein [Niveibacterium sp. COAC-50]|uniref:type IV pili methyl-accepting chemotaxis transducer N-terminal domain-containing protein n=1 Tax=Niveibacterium sp. COAC-50 TaxID=2729384 RepID=UPI001552AE28|nr:type IV pili methyl-accepting chemotaxis transducer N-terminal domain-containing protein [Niveibacterium sp. COAC-50]
MRRRELVLLGFASLVSGPLVAAPKKAAPQVSPRVLINQAGQLAMHAERIGKYWMQMGVGIDLQRAGLHLQDSTRAFDQLFAALGRSVHGEQMLLIEQRWRVYRMAWGAKPAPEGVRRVASLAQDLGEQGMKLVNQLAKAQAGDEARRVADASEARMLTQRMARIALMRQWSQAAPDASLQLDQMRKTFSARLDSLNADTGLPDAAKGDLQLARQQWAFLDQALATKEDLKATTQAANLAERERELLDSFCGHLA